MFGLDLYSNRVVYNASHPMNEGRLCWWLAQPNGGRFGGVTWIDITRNAVLTPTGTLTWKGQNHPGAGSYGSIYFGAASGNRFTGTIPFTGNNLTFHCWTYINASMTTARRLIFNADNLNTGVIIGSATGNPIASLWHSSTSSSSTATGLTISTGNWYWLCWVVTPTALTLYLSNPNGEAGLNSFAQNQTNGSATLTTWTFGGGTAGNTQWLGNMDSASLVNYAWNAEQVADMYLAELTGLWGMARQRQRVFLKKPGPSVTWGWEPAERAFAPGGCVMVPY